MSRLAFSRCSSLGSRRHRSPLRFVSAAALLWVGLGVVLVASAARADEFSPVPLGDPIYRQLRALAPGDFKADASLTRYEAALQVARVITRVSNDGRADLSRASWRALRDLTGALQGELRQLGVDTEAARALSDRHLTANKPSAPAKGVDLGSEPLTGLGAAQISALPASTPGSLGTAGALGFGGASPLRPALRSSGFDAALTPRLRVGAALLALQRAEDDPFRSSSAGQALLVPASERNGRVMGGNASVDYDVNSWLRVRAQTSQRSLLTPDQTPFSSSSFFDGATQARGAGGGLDVDLGFINFRTDIESLSTDAGARGTSVGGGIGLSAWQNRLSLSAHLARLQPEDRAVLPETKAELGIRADVTKRLNVSLLYQGLFTQRNDGSERVAGGLNLQF